MAKIITVTIDNNSGEASINLTGFADGSCTDVMKGFKGIGTVTKESNKPEFYKPVNNTAQTVKVKA